jgi:cobaltochelatase CobT
VRERPAEPPAHSDAADDPDAHAPRVAQPAPSPDEAADDVPPPSPSAAATQAAPPYRAFTTAYDRIVLPTDLCDAAELARLRTKLDGETGPMRSLLSRLANQLQRRLLAQQRRAWDFDREEGILDAARLDRVVVTPGASLAFKQERDAAFRDTVVTLLIDCSGSMRGRPILLAAIAADIVARALERCGVTSEVLGFTTADFTGGRGAAAWAQAGRPPHPGRLGDLRHIVVKSADASWRSSRLNFAVLLLPGLLRENVDGEALAWAERRLLARREQRRVLVTISDGAPAEAATTRANPPGLLDRHLHDSIAAIEAAGRIDLRAIGIRHDVSRHYRRAVTIADAQMVGPALIVQLGAVFDTAARRPTEQRRARQS